MRHKLRPLARHEALASLGRNAATEPRRLLLLWTVIVACVALAATPAAAAAPGDTTTVAGTGVLGYSGDGGLATSARLDLSSGMAVDGSGNYIAPGRRVYQRGGPTPDTTITEKPPARTNQSTATFTFSSSIGGSSFKCRLDSAPYAPCKSPHTTARLTDGSHTFYVRATDPGGNTDPTPASHTFTVRTAAVGISGSTLEVTAAPGAKDNLAITRPLPGSLRVTDLASAPYTGSGAHTGAGCTLSGDNTAKCRASGVTRIKVLAGDQDDQVVNSTGLPSSLNGGPGTDTLTGGWGNDTLIGGPGVDVMKGRGGNDLLMARDGASDKLIDCGAGNADLDKLPLDPNSIVMGCETKTRH